MSIETQKHALVFTTEANPKTMFYYRIWKDLYRIVDMVAGDYCRYLGLLNCESRFEYRWHNSEFSLKRTGHHFYEIDNFLELQHYDHVVCFWDCPSLYRALVEVHTILLRILGRFSGTTKAIEMICVEPDEFTAIDWYCLCVCIAHKIGIVTVNTEYRNSLIRIKARCDDYRMLQSI